MSEKRDKRVTLIKKLICENKIIGQQGLLDLLAEYGIDATQATISRDLRIMGVTKKRDTPRGKSYYTMPKSKGETRSLKNRNANPFFSSFISLHSWEQNSSEYDTTPQSLSRIHFKGVHISGPFVILKTANGYAPFVAKAIDDLQDVNIVATIAGYNTILLIPSETTTREAIQQIIAKVFPDITI